MPVRFQTRAGYGLGALTLSKPVLEHLSAILASVRYADRIIIALDFDGTLAPIVDKPELARVSRETTVILRELAGMEQVSMLILSGRSIEDLKKRLRLDCIYVGNHGLEIDGKGISFSHEGAEALRCAVDYACWDLEAALVGIRGVLVERKGLTATVHYRRVPDDLHAWVSTTIGFTLQRYGPWLDLRQARRAWEILPRVDWNKGTALKFLVDRIGTVAPFLICAGDDATDEDMFSAFPGAVSIRVGEIVPTAARYHVDGPATLAVFLEGLRAEVMYTLRDPLKLHLQQRTG